MKIIQINGIPLLAENYDLFLKTVIGGGSKKYFIAPITTIDLLLSYLSKKKKLNFSALTYAWPSTLLCQSVVKFLAPEVTHSNAQVQLQKYPIQSNAFLIDLLVHCTVTRKTPFFLTARHEIHRDFTHKIQRIIPLFKPGCMLPAEIANTQPDNVYQLIKKSAPNFIFLGPDVDDMNGWIKKLSDPEISSKIVYFGSDEFHILMGHKDGPSPFFRKPITEGLYYFLQKPLRFFLFPIYLFILFPFLLFIKLTKKYTITNIINKD